MENLNKHLHKTVTSRLLIRQELERAQEVLTNTNRRSVSSKHIRHAAVPPVALAATRGAPQVALLHLLVAVLRRDPPDCLHTGSDDSEGTQTRQCDPSLPLHWHDDPPQEVCALLQNLLHNALPVVAL